MPALLPPRMAKMETVQTISEAEHALSPRTDLVRRNGCLLVRKTYPHGNPLSRGLLNHEAAVLSALAGVEGVPRLVEFVPGRHLLMEYRAGRPVGTGRAHPEAYRRLERLVEELHRRRVVHLDLRQRRNILIDEQGRPTLLDFQSSIRFPANALFEPLLMVGRWVDRIALLRWKHRCFPSFLTEGDRRQLRLFRWIRPLWVLSPFKPRAEDRV